MILDINPRLIFYIVYAVMALFVFSFAFVFGTIIRNAKKLNKQEMQKQDYKINNNQSNKIKCEYCGTLIDSNETKCPYCSANVDNKENKENK